MNARFLHWIAVVPALLAASLGLAQAADPVVSNLSAAQRPGTRLVDISYNVTADTPTVTVSLEVSVDGGSTWSIPVTATSGDIGTNIAVGTGKTIVWDAGVDWNNQYSAQTRYRVTVDDGHPVINTHPASGTIDSGQTATLTVSATGTGPLTYQWYQGTSGTTTTPVGTNSSSFTTPALTMQTSYWVRISNSVGSANSNTATVSVTETMVLIPAGTFTMGRTSGDTDSNAPPVTVNVSAFYMAKHEMTKALWDEVRAWGLTNGYTDLPAGGGKAPNHPVHSINWYAVVKWCNARSQKESLPPVYTVSGAVMKTGTTAPSANWSANGYRLPTEAEWEKAARGGVSGNRFPWDTDTISHNEANFQNSGGESYASGTTGYHPTYNDGTQPYTSPVGSFGANAYGLHDMAGNVSEWCWDWYSASTYTNGATDPRGAPTGSYRVGRGGNWGNRADYCRAAYRHLIPPVNPGSGMGLRVARSSVP